MEQELVPLSEAKTRLHEVVRRLEGGRDVVIVRHGRPIAALVGFRRYRDLLARPERGIETTERGGGSVGFSGERLVGLARICEARRVRRLLLFGSAARGDAGPASDVDLLVEFLPMKPIERARAMFGLQEDLERHLGRNVDLIEDGAVRNPYLREAIDREHSVLYEAA